MKATTIGDRCRCVGDARDGGGNLTSVVDALGFTTTFGYTPALEAFFVDIQPFPGIEWAISEGEHGKKLVDRGFSGL